MGIGGDEWTPAELIDFDLAFELFDMWVDQRLNAKKEVKAPKHRDGYTTAPMYETIFEVLALGDTSDGFAQTDAEEEIAEMLASGEIDQDDLPALIDRHGSMENVLRAVKEDGG